MKLCSSAGHTTRFLISDFITFIFICSRSLRYLSLQVPPQRESSSWWLSTCKKDSVVFYLVLAASSQWYKAILFWSHVVREQCCHKELFCLWAKLLLLFKSMGTLLLGSGVRKRRVKIILEHLKDTGTAPLAGFGMVFFGSDWTVENCFWWTVEKDK